MTKNLCLIVLLGLASLNFLQATNLRHSLDLPFANRDLQQTLDDLGLTWDNEDAGWVDGENWLGNEELWIAPLVDNINNVVSQVTDGVQNAAGNLDPETNDALNTANTAVTGAVTNVLDNAGTNVDDLTNTAQDLLNNNDPTALNDALNDNAEQVAAAIDVVSNSVADGLTNAGVQGVTADDISIQIAETLYTATQGNENGGLDVNSLTSSVTDSLNNAGVDVNQAGVNVNDVANQATDALNTDNTGVGVDSLTPVDANTAVDAANNVDPNQLADSINGAINDAATNAQPQILDNSNVVASVANSINQNSEAIGAALNNVANSLQNSLGQQ